MSDQRIYHPIFLDANGQGPWPCYGCGDEVNDLLVHHIDRNHKNNDPRNLAAMHPSCHMSLHLKGTTKTVEHRAKLSEALMGTTLSPETRAKISAANKGKPKPPRSDEHRRNLSAAKRGKPPTEKQLAAFARQSQERTGKPCHQQRWQCGDCALVSTTRGLDFHQQSSGHSGRFKNDN